VFSNNLPEQKAKRYILNVLLALIQVSCAQRSVVTEYDSAKMSLQVPQGYQDSQRAISEILDLQKAKKGELTWLPNSKKTLATSVILDCGVSPFRNCNIWR
jgi:hypothetical protein